MFRTSAITLYKPIACFREIAQIKSALLNPHFAPFDHYALSPLAREPERSTPDYVVRPINIEQTLPVCNDATS